MTTGHALAAMLPWLLGAAGAIAAGLFLRWSVASVAVAFTFGRRAERIQLRARIRALEAKMDAYDEAWELLAPFGDFPR